MAQGSSRSNRNTSKGREFTRNNTGYFSHHLNFQNNFLDAKGFRFRCSNCLGEFSITLRDGSYIGISNADIGELLHSLEGSIFNPWTLQGIGAQLYKNKKCKVLVDNTRVLHARVLSVSTRILRDVSCLRSKREIKTHSSEG